MDSKKYNDGLVFLVLGIIFLLITINVIFAFIMFMMKAVFIILGILCVTGGLVNIRDSFKKK